MTDQQTENGVELTPQENENARLNIWLYRLYRGKNRHAIASGPVKPRHIRSYEHNFRPIPRSHLELIAKQLGVDMEEFFAPPNYKLLLNYQTRLLIEYTRRLTPIQEKQMVNFIRSLSRKK